MNWRAAPFCCGKFTIIRACTGTHESTRGFAGCNVTSCDEPINGRRQKSVKKFDGGKVMQHLPKQAVFLGRGLQARFDCCYQPLPDELNVLLWFCRSWPRQAALDFIDKAHKDGKPFFVWWNSTRMHIFTHLKPGPKARPASAFMPTAWLSTMAWSVVA